MIEKRPYSWWFKQDSQLRVNGQSPADILVVYLDNLSIKFEINKEELDRVSSFLIVNSFFSILNFWADRAIDCGMDRDGFFVFMRLKILALIEAGRFGDLDQLMESKGYGEHRRRWIHATICRLYSGQSPEPLVVDNEYQMPYHGHGSDLAFWALSLPSDIYRRKKLSGLLAYNSNEYSFFDGIRPAEFPLNDTILNLDASLKAHPELMQANFGSVYSTYMLYKYLHDFHTEDYYLIVQDDIATLDSLRIARASGLEEALD